MPEGIINTIRKRFRNGVEEIWAAVAVLLREGEKGPEVLLVES
ncbi:MAG: hypothetical protein ACLFVP_01280 [Candidatus Bathyarchaeia archaeon]